MTIRDAIARIAAGHDLSEADMEAVVHEIMDGEVSPAQIGALLMGLRMKGERVDEIVGAARAMRRAAIGVATSRSVVDSCGTGGDQRGTFNISTVAALIAAGAGVVVAKHGNRAMSGTVGGADVLEALGVGIDFGPEAAAACLEDVGMVFLLAPRFHPAMRHASAPRRELGVRTLFNLLGPLANPAGARAQLLGVFAREWVEPIASALLRLGSARALVVHGDDGLDEISLTGPTEIAELRGGTVTTYRLTPEDLGLRACRLDELIGSDAAANAALIRAILDGTAPRAPTDVALLNAAGVIYVAGRAPDLAAGLELAREAIRTGCARRVLDALVEFSNERRVMSDERQT